ncbi:major capsid protein [Gordonia pseudamarae]|uniref:major capsid protein n=2 Tax=Gordonia TaxID=2053 RepID=UPI001AF4EAA6|nr:major capsid protein [Gordonia pseudamarae]QHN28027.1 major capsid protein [Gordonia pseudamarae]
MALDLQTMIDKAAEGSTEKQRTAAVATLLEDATRGDLDQLLSEVTDKFSALDDTDPTSEDQVLGLEYLAAVAVAAKAAQKAADKRIDEVRAKRADLAAKVLGDTTADVAADDTDPGVEDSAEQGNDTSTDGAETDTEQRVEVTEPVATDVAPAVEAVSEPVAVAASAGKRFNLANIQQKAPAPTKPAVTITASADVSGYAGGQNLDYTGLVAAAASKIESVTRAGVNTSGSIAQVHLDFPDHLVASGANDADVIETAVDQSKLAGGSIVAAGGWCAPSEVIYDLVDLLADTKTGLISVPEIQAKRGGIRTAMNLGFAKVWAGNAGLIQTDVQANETPVLTPPVDAPDEQPVAPQVTDLSGLTDTDLLELMQDANRVGDDELYDAAVAEWDARSALDHSREDDTETPSSLSEPAGGPVETDAQFAGLDDAELIAVMNDAINADDDDLYRAAAAAEWARREGLTSAGRVRDEAFWSRRWRRPAAYGEPIRGGRSQIPQRGGDHPQRTTNRFMPSGTDLPDEYQDLPGGSPIPFTPRTAPMPTPEDMERVLDKHRHDSTVPNKSRFPESWSDQDVAGAIAITIQLPDRPVQRFGTSLVFERDVDGILVRAQVRTDSDPSIFWSAYPPKVVD